MFSHGRKSNEPLPEVPAEFQEMARRFVQTLREQLGANEVRALAASQVASPVLQVSVGVPIYVVC